MIDLKGVLLMPVAAGLLSQPILRDSAAAVAARSCPNVRMPGAAQVAAGQSSADAKHQKFVAVASAVDSPPRQERGRGHRLADYHQLD